MHARLFSYFLFCCVLAASRLGFGHVCVHMRSTCAHILKVCIRIQLGCIRRPYVCTCILKPRNLNPSFLAYVSLFLFNMLLFWSVFICIHPCFLQCFLCFSMNMHSYVNALMHRCCDAMR